MKTSRTRSKVRPIGTATSNEKQGKGIHPDPIFRLIQNSRRIPPSSLVPQRDSSTLLSFVRVFGKAFVVWISQRRKKRDLYERLAQTVDEIASDPPELFEELAAGEKPHRGKSRTSKVDRKASGSK